MNLLRATGMVVPPTDADLSGAAWENLVNEATAFRRAGGVVSLRDWAELERCERAALVEAYRVVESERAAAVAIVDQTSYEYAAGLIKVVAEWKYKVVEHHKEPKQKAHDAHKAIVAAEKRMLEPLERADRILRDSLSKWEVEQERIRQEAAHQLERDTRLVDGALGGLDSCLGHVMYSFDGSLMPHAGGGCKR